MRTTTSTLRNEYLFGNLSTLEKSNHSYVFMISGGEYLLYGVCVTKFELLEVREEGKQENVKN
jgi:hypothetical protein